MRRTYLGLVVALVLIGLATLLGCGGNRANAGQSPAGSGTVYVTGSDAPLPAVVAFQLNISSLTLSNGSTSVTLEDPGLVEFSRLLGLRTLLSLSSVPPGTYTSAQITVASPVISYLDMSTTPPSVVNMNGSLVSNSLTLPLNPPLIVGSNQLGGLHLHLDLRNSLFTDGSGQITGQVNPQIQLRVLAIGDDDAEVDELRGGVHSVGANSFVMQRPHGRQITVDVNDQTQWFPANNNLSTIAPPTTIEVSGKIQADGSLLADSVEVLSHDAAFVGGLILNVNPPSGDANTITLLVRTEIPDIPSIPIPGATTLNVNSSTAFLIRDFQLPVSAYLFNRSMLVLGQRVGVGGVLDTQTNPISLDVRRVVLRRQGVDGVPGNVTVNSGNTGSFTLANNGMFGYILGGTPLKVMTSNLTVFRNLSGLADVGQASRVRVVGLVLKDPVSNTPVLVAGYVAKLN